MHFERRELYASFWDSASQTGVYALLIGWDDQLRPVVAYNFGLETLTGRFEIATNLQDARRNANIMGAPKS